MDEHVINTAPSSHDAHFSYESEPIDVVSGADAYDEATLKIEAYIEDAPESSVLASAARQVELKTETDRKRRPKNEAQLDFKFEQGEIRATDAALVPGAEDATGTYGLCGKCSLPDVAMENDQMIECNTCKKWFHASCVELDDVMCKNLQKFFCPACDAEYGPSTLNDIVAPHRLSCFSKEEVPLPEQVGSKQWTENFASTEENLPGPQDITAIDANEYQIHTVDNGHLIPIYFDALHEWKHVILVKDPDGLDMQIPPPSFSIDDVANIVGPAQSVETIDVYRQESSHMLFKNFVKFWKNPARPRLFNILSLEYSDTPLMQYFVPPKLVRDHSWVSQTWSIYKPGETVGDTYQAWGSNEKPPHVELFCLIGMAGSYTDFHIDFGGSSVYYHIHTGKKIFYVAPPTKENLLIYHDRQINDNGRVGWLGDRYIENGTLRRIVIHQGCTLIIPAGWIHAVYTPEDSLVFGGNFLHSHNIAMQLKVNKIEVLSQVEERFMFPRFEECNFYAAKLVATEIADYNESGNLSCPDHLYSSAKKLLTYLQRWYQARPYNFAAYGESIIKTLERELARQEKRIKKRLKEKDDSFGPRAAKMSKKDPLRLLIKRDSTSSQPPEMIPKVRAQANADQELVESMFSKPSTSGRLRKPTAAIRDICGGDISVLTPSLAESSLSSPIALDDEEFERIQLEEEREMLAEERRQKNAKKSMEAKAKQARLGIAKATSSKSASSSKAAPSRPKKELSVKQRLAKKLKL